MKRTLTKAEAATILSYDPSTGVFRNLVDRHWSSKAGDIAGFEERHGYVKISIAGHKYYAHRLAWLFMTGEWPSDQVDHIDGNRSNNAWANLRECSNALNQANRRCTSRVGLKGVTLHSDGKWMAQIMVGKRRIYLGLFDAPEFAHEAYCLAADLAFGSFALHRREVTA
ncbi:HNH endonuclease [Burkholderia gladioli]|uniref:HNH endonuclease n=1 Tax=Burkholderia gladioli TaxID=28095 RepID=UPI001ABAC56C|nr:HNH endonuclease [Burkholderia gladioli]